MPVDLQDQLVTKVYLEVLEQLVHLDKMVLQVHLETKAHKEALVHEEI